MNYIDEDMWKKQEQINTILDYLCGSDEEVAEDNKRINSWNWFQRKIYILGDTFEGWYLMGLLKRTKLNAVSEDFFISPRASLWGKTRVSIAKKDESVDQKNWNYLFIFYIKWFFTWIINQIKFSLKIIIVDNSDSELN